MRADDVNAEYGAGVGVGDDLGEALAAAADDGLGNGLERDPADREGRPCSTHASSVRPIDAISGRVNVARGWFT